MQSITHALLLLSLSSTAVAATPGSALWEDQVGEDTHQEAWAVQSSYAYVFTAGFELANADSADTNWVVRVYNRRYGTLRWEDVRSGSGGLDRAWGIDYHPNGVVVVGGITNANGNRDVAVRAYDHFGNLEWEYLYDAAGGNDEAFDVKWYNGVVYVVGHVEASTAESAGVVIALDGTTGDVVWLDPLDGPGEPSVLWSVDANQYRIGVAGSSLVDEQQDFYVQMYSHHTGSVTWADSIDLAGGDDVAVDIHVGTSRVVATGSGTSESGDRDVLTVAWDVAGQELWRDQYDSAGGDDEANSLTTNWPSDSRVHLAGSTTSTRGDTDFLVRTVSFVDGSEIWTHEIDGVGGELASLGYAESGSDDSAWAITGGKYRLFVVGQEKPFDGVDRSVVRSYTPSTGAMGWETLVESESLVGISDYNEVEVHAVGCSYNAGSAQGDYTVRALSR